MTHHALQDIPKVAPPCRGTGILPVIDRLGMGKRAKSRAGCPCHYFGIVLAFAFACAAAPGAEPLWGWQKGDSAAGYQTGVYGAQGTPAAANTPGARRGAATWRDAAGRLWLFGGYNYKDESFPSLSFNDLWRFDPATGAWTWIKGSDQPNRNGVYGAQGAEAPANTPGARSDAATWTDAAGRLWLFGGRFLSYEVGASATAVDNYSDLWHYDPATNNWTWIKGSNKVNRLGIYGTKGVADPANLPGSRHGAAAWVDAAGRLWLFGGGYHVNYSIQQRNNELWCFDPASGNWTWVKGSQTVNSHGVYGTLGVADPANTPGAREGAACCTGRDGRFWLYGGEGAAIYDGMTGYLNDLWRFDPASGDWTCVKVTAQGLNFLNQPGVFASLGVAGAANTPSGRRGAAAWVDAYGWLWIFGGVGAGQTASGLAAKSALNDMWRFAPEAGTWACFKGSAEVDRPGVYGTRGTAAAANTPGARADAAAWAGKDGRLWFFGGLGRDAAGALGDLNDLWRASVPPNAVKGGAWFGLE